VDDYKLYTASKQANQKRFAAIRPLSVKFFIGAKLRLEPAYATGTFHPQTKLAA
jgi:hypothetical protein